MSRVRRTAAASVLLLAGLLAVPGAAAAVTACTPTVLPTPAGTTGYDVAGTDGDGTVVGSVLDGTGARRGVVWRDGTATLLDDFVPADVNESGLMGGYTVVSSTGRAAAAVRPLDGAVRTIATGYYISFVAGVNAAGDAVGRAFIEHPVVDFSAVWFAPDFAEEGFFGSGGMTATEIDDTGLAMGVADYDGTVDTVWLAEKGNEQVVRRYGPETGVRLYDLDDGVLAATHNRHVVTINGRSGAETVVPGSLDGTPAEINDGVIVGQAWGFAMMWRGGQGLRLPAPPGTTTRAATAVNASGTQAAGMSVRADGTAVPTLWNCAAG